MELFKQLKEFIVLVQTTDVSEKELVSKSSAIKRSYSRYIQTLLSNGNLTQTNLDKIKKLIIDNYKDLKLYPVFNEILEDIANRYLHIAATEPSLNEDSVQNLKSAALATHVAALGTNGSHPEKYPADYLVTIIRRKMDKHGINNPEILQILMQISKNLSTYNFEDFQKLANDTLIVAVDGYFQNGKPDLTNPQIIAALSELANSYKAMANIEMYEMICQKALNLKKFEHSTEYQNLLKDRSGISLQDAGFTLIKLPAAKNLTLDERFEHFFQQLRLIPAFQSIFSQETPSPRTIKNPGDTKNHNIPTKEFKIRKIFEMLEQLKKQYPDINITTCYLGKDSFLPPEVNSSESKLNSFTDYVIFPLDGTNISMLECFDMSKEGGFYTAYTRDLPQVISTTRTNARKIPGVNFFPHTTHYRANVIEDITKRLKDEQTKREQQQQAARKQQLLEAQQRALDYLMKDQQTQATLNHGIIHSQEE